MKTAEPVGPYSVFTIHNGTIYVSGQVAIVPGTNPRELVTDTIENETHQVMKNLGAALSNAGSSFAHVKKCDVFVRDMKDYSAINDVYVSYFGDAPRPARALVEVSHLPLGVNIEISCIAALPEEK